MPDRSAVAGSGERLRHLGAALLALSLAVVGLVSAPPSPAHADEILETVGDFVFVAFDDNVPRGARVFDYVGSETDIVIPAQVEIAGTTYAVTSIGTGALADKDLTAVTIPSSIQSIEELAFFRNHLTELVIPDSVTTIHGSAFGLNRLESLTLGSGLIYIGPHAFDRNPLRTVAIPDSVTVVDVKAFSRNQIESLTLGSGLLRIGSYAFEQNQLTELVIPDSVTLIDEWAFYANRIESLTLSNSLKTIHRWAFVTNRLTELTIPASVTVVGLGAFHGSPSLSAVRFEGDAPAVAEAGSVGSFGFTEGKTLYFRNSATGFTQPTWMGYNTRALHAISFETQGGGAISPVTLADGERLAAPDDPARDGHTFTGWFADATGLTPFDFDTPITGDLTLFAGWQINTYTVTFDRNGGSPVPPVTVEHGDTITAPTDPEREGHVFTGWHIAPGTPFDFDTPVTSNLTLHAGWQINTYTVTFDTGAGSTVDPVTVDHGETITAPADPVREGYGFTGWFVDAQAAAEFDFDTPITADLTLYAGWQINTYTVTFDAGGGSAVPPASVEHGDTITAPADPTRDGHEFTGWFADAAAETPFDFDTAIIADLTLHAGWETKAPDPETPAPEEDPDTELPKTGASSSSDLLTVGALLTVGGLAILLARRRTAHLD